MAKKTARPRPPEGIDADQVEPKRGLGHHASILSLAVLGAVVAIGLSGYAGGRMSRLAATSDAVEMTITTPRVIRNGDIMETQVRVVARQRIGKLVIGVEPGLWREITTNSMMPSAGSESYEDGLLRFAFDRLEPGKTFELQIAQQINPGLFGSNRGRIVVLDDKRPLAETAVTLEVLP